MRGRKKAAVLALILLISCLGGCSNMMTGVYDDASMLVKDSNTYNKVNWKSSIEDRKYTVSAVKFEGMDTIWTYDAPEDASIEITYLVKVHDGKMKLVLIAPDDTLTTIAEITTESSMEEAESVTLELEKGENRIKLVGGKDTKLDMEIFISEGKFNSK